MMLCDWWANDGQRACWRQAVFICGRVQDRVRGRHNGHGRYVCHLHRKVLDSAMERVLSKNADVRLTLRPEIRTARHLIDRAMQYQWEVQEDPMNAHVGFYPPSHPPRWLRPSLQRLGTTTEELTNALDLIIKMEIQHTGGNPPHAYNQMSYITVEL